MKRWTVSADLIVPVLIEVEAVNEDYAAMIVEGMNRRTLLALANTEHDAIAVNVDGVTEAP